MVADDWLLFSTCVARMGELHPKYRSHLGYARRDLESAIRAGRCRLRGRRPRQSDDLPTAIEMPITSRHTLDLSHNRLSERTRHHFGGLLFRDVEIEWNSIAEYLRARAAESWPIELSSRRPMSQPRARSPNRTKARELADRYIREEKNAGRRPTQKRFVEFVGAQGSFRGGRDLLRSAYNDVQLERGGIVGRGRPKKSPS
jgi:hypothetical protein